VPIQQNVANPAQHERLNSWKEIAAHLKCGERTAKRWEKTRALPVRRLPGGPGLVFALKSEIDAWRLSTAGVEVYDSAAEAKSDPVVPSLSEGSSRLGSRVDAPSRSFRVAAIVTVVVATVISVSDAGRVYYRHKSATVNPARDASPAISRGSSNPEAQELYLRGHYLLSLRTDASITQAIDLFTQAIVRDPHFAAAYASLADCYLLIREYGHMHDAEAYPRALAASQQANALDPSSADAHASYAFILNYWVWNFPAAEQEYQRAIVLNPNDPQTHHWYATSLFSAGKFKDAMKEIDTARRLDPDSVAILASRGLLLASVNLKAGQEFLEQTEKANPQFSEIPGYLSVIYARLNDWPRYIEEMEKCARLNGDEATVALMKSASKELEVNGPRGLSRTMAENFGKQADNGNGSAMSAAYFYAQLGNQERTLHYLSLGCSHREPGFLYMRYEPKYNFLHPTRAYQALLLPQPLVLPSNHASAESQAPLPQTPHPAGMIPSDPLVIGFRC
jgi:tetratricopeptide (TPR) repeat protein